VSARGAWPARPAPRGESRGPAAPDRLESALLGRAALLSAVVALLGGCATATAPPAALPAPAAAWQAPLPHEGQLAQLQRWWQQFDDPLLPRLIADAQQAAPTVAAARARIEGARAARTAAGAALLPAVQASAQGQRGRSDLVSPLGSSAALGAQALWEVDLFGGRRAAAQAAQARLEGAEAAWHEARVSVAAEVAASYVALRACEAQLVQSRLDAASRAETARLTELSARAGFTAPANAALARASAAQGSVTLSQQRASCEGLVKSLVALTAADEPALRAELARGAAVLPRPAAIAVPAVPAAAIAQRPDVHAAALEVAASAADTAEADARRWPRITLAGQIGHARFEGGGLRTDGTVWSLGPLTVTLPVFDAGVRRADAAAARTRHEAARVAYAAALRGAVREVELALVALQSTAERNEDAVVAAEGFERSYRATESRHRGGLASLFELEDARRTAVAAQGALIELQRERVAAWVALYRALGGGWSTADAMVSGGWSTADAPTSLATR